MSRWFRCISAGLAFAGFGCAQGWADSYATGCAHGSCFPVVCDDRGDNCTGPSGRHYRGDAHFPVAWQDTRYGGEAFDTANRYGGGSGLDAENMRWGGLGYDLRNDHSYDRQSEAGGRW